MRRRPLAALLAAATLVTSGEDVRAADDVVVASNQVVVHGVDTKLVAARLRDADRKTLAGDAKGAAADLAELLTADATPLVEDGENSYVVVLEAALQRIALLPPDALEVYRRIVDPRAKSLLDGAGARGDAGPLARHALEFALSTHGPRLLVALADVRAARGDADLAAQALTDLLRLWPESGATAEMPGVDRASVVARLASLFAALGDEPSTWWLREETSARLLDGPSPATAGGKLADDLARCAQAAAKRGARAVGPTGPLVPVAEHYYFDKDTPRDRFEHESDSAREPDERPIVIGTPERPAILTREPAIVRQSHVLALAAPTKGGRLVELWRWPSDGEYRAMTRRESRGPFRPARCGDVVLFPWPTEPSSRVNENTVLEEPRCTLVALSISGEGRLLDERGGPDELTRDDADMDLVPPPEDADAPPALSFAGGPLVVGRSVYATLVRRVKNSDATELHLARFDLVGEGATRKLRLRWRTHVLDGMTMPRVLHAAEETSDRQQETLAVPAPLVERWGRIYLTSGTGAVACVDAADGRTAWVHAYPRFGPPQRLSIGHDTTQRTWDDVPVLLDGPYVWTAPSDAEFLLQFRAMPRSARTTLVASWRFHGGAGTNTESGPLLANHRPREVVEVVHGVGWFSGEIAWPPGLVSLGGPLASLRLRETKDGEPRRAWGYAQIVEYWASGTPCLVEGAMLFPTTKAVYRVPLADFESAPTVLWTLSAGGTRSGSTDAIGNLVADGDRLWSVTPQRALLLAPK